MPRRLVTVTPRRLAAALTPCRLVLAGPFTPARRIARTALRCLSPSIAPTALAGVVLLGAAPAAAQQQAARGAAAPAHDPVRQDETGAALYAARCATCHGPGGRLPRAGAPTIRRPYDFTNCSVASAEPDAPWTAAIRDGGPAVGLSPDMPAFGGTLTGDEIARLVEYLRGLCLDRGWPDGNLNLPRPIFTEKAFPEDEVVVLPALGHRTSEGDSGALTTIIEKRVGKRSNVEAAFPLASIDSGFGRESGLGDIELAFKHVLLADRGPRRDLWRIVSAGVEIALPTGSERRGLGEGTVRFEPFLAAGVARGASTLQGTLILELPRSAPWQDHAWEYNLYVGRDLTTGVKRWTAGIELNGEQREMALTPQIRRSLTKTGALAAAVGVQIPVAERDEQHVQVAGYLLWDYREPLGRRRR